MWGVAKIFTSGHSKGGFDRTPRTPPGYGYGYRGNANVIDISSSGVGRGGGGGGGFGPPKLWA